MRLFFTFVAVIACAISMSASADLAVDDSGNLFVSAANSNMILKFAPGGTKTTFAAGVEGALALDSAGNLFVGVSDATGTIFKVAPDGTKSTFSASVGNPSSLAFDPAGSLFVFDLESGSILKFTPNGNQSTFNAGKKPAGQMFAGSTYLACDRAGNLFVADQDSATIFKFAPDGTKSTFATKVKATGLALDPTGNLFAVNFWSSTIAKFTMGREAQLRPSSAHPRVLRLMLRAISSCLTPLTTRSSSSVPTEPQAPSRRISPNPQPLKGQGVMKNGKPRGRILRLACWKNTQTII
jgi:streptogramin lyase